MMDFKGWKKTKEDSKSVTMAHPKGHEMIIVVSKLPAIQREAIKRLPLAEGGKVDNPGWKAKGWEHEKDYTTGVHRDVTGKGQSFAGEVARKGHTARAEDLHENRLEELKNMPNPKLKGLS